MSEIILQDDECSRNRTTTERMYYIELERARYLKWWNCLMFCWVVVRCYHSYLFQRYHRTGPAIPASNAGFDQSTQWTSSAKWIYYCTHLAASTQFRSLDSITWLIKQNFQLAPDWSTYSLTVARIYSRKGVERSRDSRCSLYSNFVSTFWILPR